MQARRRIGTGPVLVSMLLGLALSTSPVGATNGMNLEGYGPVAAGMGGAGLAYDNGTAAMMNNPSTLALGREGTRLDLALGMLGPQVTARVTTPAGALDAESDATAFIMPALGAFWKRARLGLGLGVYSQGGMGTEYAGDTWLADPSQGANTALGEGLVNRSEVSVGRVIVPVTYDLSEKVRLGASLDLVWAGMDLQMAMSEAQFQNLANPQAQTLGTAAGSLVDAFGMLYEPFGGTGIERLHHAYFDFSNDNDFTGQATGYGLAGKLGVHYQPLPELSFGATYHSPTALSDLETEEARLAMAVRVDPGVFQGAPTGEYMDMEIPVRGQIAVDDFQWPWMLGFGVAYEPTARLLLAADLRYIAWSAVMKDFRMIFTADDTPENGSFAGLRLDAALFQEWEDQTVLSLGGAYDLTEAFTVRAGFNRSANPVPADYLNALFPAIVEDHLTFGAGYRLGGRSRLDASLTTALETEETQPGTGTTLPPVTSSHSQLNWMVMYTHQF